MLYQFDFDVNQTAPGIFAANMDTDLKNILGVSYKQKVPLKNVLLYTDYDSIQLRYQCQEVENYWYTDINEDYYILVRNRTFDSYRPVANMLRFLDRFTDIDTFHPYQYDPFFCKN